MTERERMEALRRAHRLECSGPSPCNGCDMLAHIVTLTTALREARAENEQWLERFGRLSAECMDSDKKLRDAERLAADWENGATQSSIQWNEAMIRAEHAEQRVAGLEAALNKARDSLYWIKMHSHGEVHGDAMNAVDRIDTALTLPPGAPPDNG